MFVSRHYQYKKNVPFILLHAVYGRVMRRISLISTSKPPTIYACVCACRAIGRKERLRPIKMLATCSPQLWKLKNLTELL